MTRTASSNKSYLHEQSFHPGIRVFVNGRASCAVNHATKLFVREGLDPATEARFQSHLQIEYGVKELRASLVVAHVCQ